MNTIEITAEVKKKEFKRMKQENKTALTSVFSFFSLPQNSKFAYVIFK